MGFVSYFSLFLVFGLEIRGTEVEVFVCYFVFTASDGYRVVFSWNEIYNSESGKSFYIITEMKGKSLLEMDQRIAFLSSKDLKSGRRYIKCLESIEVKKI